MARIVVAAPIRPSSTTGNDVTANRWVDHLRSSGHTVSSLAVDETTDSVHPDADEQLGDADVLIALHARRSAPVIRWWRTRHPDRPLVVGLAGTDLYVDLPGDQDTVASLRAATALIVLQHDAVSHLGGFDRSWAAKAHVIHQSVVGPLPRRAPVESAFRVVVLAHLRDVKDPLLAAQAVRSLPANSSIVVDHAGRAFDDDWRRRAEAEHADNPRYTWLGELDRAASLELLASTTVLACTSRSEGGANVVSEAIGLGVPVIGTRIGGNVGLLGDDHPGWFAVGDHEAMTRLLLDLESRPDRLVELESRSLQRRHLVDPGEERRALDELVSAVLEG